MKRLARLLIARAVSPLGYRVSGNHIFSLAEFARIDRMQSAHAVAERPELYPARVVRFAQLLAATYL